MDRSPGSIARLLTCVKDDLVNLKSYFEKWNSKQGMKSLIVDQRDIEIEVKTLLTRFQHSLRDLLSTLPEWRDVDTITMAQQINQLAVGEMCAMKESAAVASGQGTNSGSVKRGGATPTTAAAGSGGRDELYKCINQLATKIAERSLPLFMGDSGPTSQPQTRGSVKKSPTLETGSNSSRHSLLEELSDLGQPSQQLPASVEDATTSKYRDSPTGSASLNSPDIIMSAATLARTDPGILQDNMLALRDRNAVDFVFNRGKNFSKYIFDYIKNEEKRITAEVEHIRALAKNCQVMATTVQPNQTTQSNLCMPLQAHLINYSKNVSEKCREFESRNYAQCWDELEHLKKKNVNFDNKRKTLKDQWKDQLKKTADARTHHEKAKNNYFSRCQVLEKLRADEADITAQLQAQTSTSSGSDSTYGSSGDVNDSPAPSSSSSSTLSTVGPGGVAYGPLSSTQSGNSSSGSAGMSGSGETTTSAAGVTKLRNKAEKLYRQRVESEGKQREAEDDYRQAVFRLNEVLKETEEQRTAVLRRARELNVDMEFVFKQTNVVIKKNEQAITQELQRLHSRHTEEMETYQPGSKYSEAIEVYIRPRKEEYQMTLVNFEPYQFSQGSSGGQTDRQKSVSELVQLRRITPSSKSSTTHRSPPAGGSRDEDSYDGTSVTSERTSAGGRSSVYSGQGEYEDGTMGSMKTTLNEWASNIKNKLSIKSRRSGTSGDCLVEMLSIEQEVKHARYILYRCITEIEDRGLRQTGLYRCSASVKSIVNVMENLQVEGQVVDLSDESIYTLCGVIKSALKGLSEPLLTYEAYSEFLDIGKEAISSPPPPDSLLVARLNRVNNTLPDANKMTCGILFHHLRKVSSHSADNQMTAANLGTCLSPTLLKPKSARSTVKADVGDMMDNPPRSRVIELLITHVEEIFGPRNEYIPELDFSCHSPPPVTEDLPPVVEAVIESAPNSAPPLSSPAPPSLIHPPAVRSASDSTAVSTRMELWQGPTPSVNLSSNPCLLRPGAVSSCSSRSSDSTDFLSSSHNSQSQGKQESGSSAHRTASQGAQRNIHHHHHHPHGTPEPSEIAFIDNDDSAGEDLGHSGEALSSSMGASSKKNIKKTVISLFRKRKHDDLPANGRLKPGNHSGRSLDHLSQDVPNHSPIDRVASVHIPVSIHSDDSEYSGAERRPLSAHDLDSCKDEVTERGRRRSVTRLGRTEGDGHSTPTSPVVTPRREQPPKPTLSSLAPQQHNSSLHGVELRRSSPALPLPSSAPPSTSSDAAVAANRLRRRLSDNFERSQEARALVRDRHRAALRQSPVTTRDRSCPASRERRRHIQSTPPTVKIPPKIRSPLEPRRAAERKATRCQQNTDDYRDVTGPEAKPLELTGSGANLTPRRSHPEFV